MRTFVYSQNAYEKQKVLKQDANFESSFQEDLCLIPVQLGDRPKLSLTSNNNDNR